MSESSNINLCKVMCQTLVAKIMHAYNKAVIVHGRAHKMPVEGYVFLKVIVLNVVL